MRITSGKWRGLRLKAPKHPGLRPMMDRVRKALFDILGPRVEGARVLDLFCGTGALGLEALSRGAKEVVFIDESPAALRLVKENLRRAGLTQGVHLERLRLPRELFRLSSSAPFDLVLITPPYGQGLAAKVLPLLIKENLLSPGAVVVVEEREGASLPEVKGLAKIKERVYGQTKLDFFVYQPEGGPDV